MLQSPPELMLPLIYSQCVRDYKSLALEYNIGLKLFWRNSCVMFSSACQSFPLRQHERVERPEAIAELRKKCDELSRQITGLHPLVPGLQDAATQGEILRALFELTKQVEVVKKHLLKLEKGDNSTLV